MIDDDEESRASAPAGDATAQGGSQAAPPPEADEDAIAELYGDERDALEEDGVDGEDLFGDDMEKYDS